MHRTLLLVTLLAPLLAFAQPQPEKVVAAKQLTRLLQLERLFETYVTACASPEGTTFDPKAEFRSRPTNFGGVSPQSAYWPEVEKIYSNLNAATCAYASSEKYSRFFEEQYAKRMSLEDLRAAIAFHSSPAGKRFQETVVAADRDFQTYANQLQLKAYEVAHEQFQQDIRELLKRYKANPK